MIKMIGTILLRSELTGEQFSELLTEFPQYHVIPIGENEPLSTLGEGTLSDVEIFMGKHLTEEEFALLPRLHWIHSPIAYLDGIALDPIRKQENILVTTTKEENIEQMGRFAMAATLAFAKNLFNWQFASLHPGYMEISELRKGMWHTDERVFLQVGLGTIGSKIAEGAKNEGFIVWGASETASFNPFCEKTYFFHDLPNLLPRADVVSIALPRDKVHSLWFDKEKFEQMKQDSILLVFGSGSGIHIEDLMEMGDKFRGILIDAHFSPPIDCNHPLLKRPNVIFTFESGEYPKEKNPSSFHVFTANLRQFQHGNYAELKNLVEI